MEKVSSPESLNDYIKVTTPSVWIVLIALVQLVQFAGNALSKKLNKKDI